MINPGECKMPNFETVKVLIRILVTHFREECKWQHVVYTATVVALLIALNYGLDIDKLYFKPHRGSTLGVILYFLYYALAYMLVAVPIMIVTKKGDILKKAAFWVKSLVFLLIIALQRSLDLYHLENHHFEYYTNYFFDRLMTNFELLIIALLPVVMMKYMYDSKNRDLYGLGLNGSKAKLFFVLILFLIPLIGWASFQADFQQMYPRFKPWLFPEGVGWGRWTMFAVFELSYTLDFVSTEWIYRGALVIGMAYLMGKDAILPMLVVYVAIHFGKPLAESISSFFGGYLLAVFALHLRSIWGGAIVHIGLALMMETGAIIVHYFGPPNGG